MVFVLYTAVVYTGSSDDVILKPAPESVRITIQKQAFTYPVMVNVLLLYYGLTLASKISKNSHGYMHTELISVKKTLGISLDSTAFHAYPYTHTRFSSIQRSPFHLTALLCIFFISFNVILYNLKSISRQINHFPSHTYTHTHFTYA